MWEIESLSNQATETIGKKLGSLLVSGDFVSLVGELGAGKTTMVRGITSGLEVRDRVSSPSFLVIQEYQGKYPVFHGDFYRLDSYQELEDIGWDEYFQRKGIILIEWGNLIPEAIPKDHLEISIEGTDSEGSRILRFCPHGSRYEAIVGGLIKKCEYWE